MLKNIVASVIVLLASIPSNTAAAPSATVAAPQSYQIVLDVKSPMPIFVKAAAKPDYDKEVLEPLRAAQKAAADKKAKEEADAQAAAKAAAEAQAAADARAAADAAAQAAQAAKTAAANAASVSYYGNTYDWGNCTWYVASRRNVPSNWGNAKNWFAGAQAAGWATGYSPRAGAIGVSFNGWAGHVVYVESVNNDGSINVSEMNVNGLGVKDYSTYSASSFVYIY